MFSLLVLVVTAYTGGWVVSLAKLPPLLGMLLVGKLEGYEVLHEVKDGVSADLYPESTNQDSGFRFQYLRIQLFFTAINFF